MSENMCSKTGCGKLAEHAVGVEVYPPKSLMQYYRISGPITRLVFGLPVCKDHIPTLEELGGADALEPVIKVLESAHSVEVDRSNYKVVAVQFTDADYLILLQRAKPTLN